METADKKLLRDADEQETALKKSEKQARKKLDELKNALGIQTARKAALTDEKLKSEVALDMIVGEGKNDPQLEAIIVDLESKIRLTERNLTTLTRSIAEREAELKTYPAQYMALETRRREARLYPWARRARTVLADLGKLNAEWVEITAGMPLSTIDKNLYTSANRNGTIKTAVYVPRTIERIYIANEDEADPPVDSGNWNAPRHYHFHVDGTPPGYNGNSFVGGERTKSGTGALC